MMPLIHVLFRLGAAAQPWCADAAALLARLVIGQAFAQAGWGKLHRIDQTTEFFASLGIPAPGLHAVLIGCLEFVGGLLLVAGFGVRAVGLLLSATMVVALVTAERSAAWAALAISPEKGFTDISAAMYLIVLLPLIAHGAGRLSVDALMRTWFVAPGSQPTSASAPMSPPRS